MYDDPSALLTPQTKEALLAVARENQELSEQVFDAVVGFRRQNAGVLTPELTTVLNTNEFILLLNFDLAVLLEDVVSAVSDMRANLYARTLLLTVYESARSLRRLLDHRFRAAFSRIVASPPLDELLKDAHSKITRLHQECESQFADVRNGLLGHKDADAETRVQLLEKTAAEPVVGLTIQLTGALLPVIKILTLCWTDDR